MEDNVKYRVELNLVEKEINPYPVPPFGVITECPIRWTLAQATNKRHSKHLAAMIILGQPFNRKRR
jgi:hypothetical protein